MFLRSSLRTVAEVSDRYQLTADESLLLDLRPHWVQILPEGLLAGLALLVLGWGVSLDGRVGDTIAKITLPLVVIAVLRLLFEVLRWRFTHFAVTSERIVVRSGVLARNGIEIPLERINTVFFEQKFHERLLRSGDLIIESASETGRQRFADIKDPGSVQERIYTAMEGLADRGRLRSGQAIADAFKGLTAAPSTGEELERLAALRDRGDLSAAEFEELKRRLLGGGSSSVPPWAPPAV